MNIAELQSTLRHFAAERDWQAFHTPKNLSTALMVEAAELAEVFQWMTPEESRDACTDAVSKQRIEEELADVLLYLLQVADHTGVDLEQAVDAKLASNARKYPAKRAVAPVPPGQAPLPDTHILLDYENVQPTEAELRALVPDATKVWVFHGPHQKHVEQHFASFGSGLTPVPISKTGKNALDFHLSFYVGYIVSRHPNARIVVVANDKGYEPMLEHARSMGFPVRQQGHARAAEPVARKAAAKKVAAKQAVAKQPAAKKKVVAKPVVAKKAVAKKTVAKKATPPAAKKAAKRKGPELSMLQKLTDSLRKMGDKRPARRVSLQRALKPLLGVAASEESAEAALNQLIAGAVVAIGASGAVTYPLFAKDAGAAAVGA